MFLIPGVLPLIDTLIQLLERFSHPQMIVILLDALVPLTQAYTRFFAPHFTNIIGTLELYSKLLFIRADFKIIKIIKSLKSLKSLNVK